MHRDDHFDQLCAGYLTGVLSADERVELEDMLRDNKKRQLRFAAFAQMDVVLGQEQRIGRMVHTATDAAIDEQCVALLHGFMNHHQMAAFTVLLTRDERARRRLANYCTQDMVLRQVLVPSADAAVEPSLDDQCVALVNGLMDPAEAEAFAQRLLHDEPARKRLAQYCTSDMVLRQCVADAQGPVEVASTESATATAPLDFPSSALYQQNAPVDATPLGTDVLASTSSFVEESDLYEMTPMGQEALPASGALRDRARATTDRVSATGSHRRSNRLKSQRRRARKLNNTIPIPLVAGLVVAAAAMLIALMLPSRAMPVQPVEPEIVDVTVQPVAPAVVKIVSASQASVDRTQLKVGERLPLGSVITTGSAGSVRLRWLRDGSELELIENSQLILTSGRSRARLDRGALTVSAAKQQLGQQLAIATPFAETHVIGTIFSIRAEGLQDHVRVRKGVVRVTARRSGETIDLFAGQDVSIDANGLILDPPIDHTIADLPQPVYEEPAVEPEAVAAPAEPEETYFTFTLADGVTGLPAPGINPLTHKQVIAYEDVPDFYNIIAEHDGDLPINEIRFIVTMLEDGQPPHNSVQREEIEPFTAFGDELHKNKERLARVGRQKRPARIHIRATPYQVVGEQRTQLGPAELITITIE